MQFNHTLSAILRGHWMLDRQWAESHLPLVLLMLKGNPVSFVQPGKPKASVERTGDAEFEMPFVVDPKTMDRHDYYIWTWQKGYVANPNIPENSVGVIPLTGPVTKYDGSCGEPGAISKATLISAMGKRANIGSLILLHDTPGGESRASTVYTSALEKFGKPKLSLVDDMSASLGMFPLAASDEVYLSHEGAEVGSVGSYMTLFDFRGYLEKEGIKLHEIYAPQSTEKNKNYHDALQGNYDAIKADLKFHVDAFVKYVKNNRGDKAAENEKAWNSGRMFYANEAVNIGLADGIKNFEQVVSKAAWLGKRKK